MTFRSNVGTASLSARAAAIASRHRRLAAEIDEEHARPLPCQFNLKRLKRAKLRLKDELATIDGVLTTVDHARLEGRAA